MEDKIAVDDFAAAESIEVAPEDLNEKDLATFALAGSQQVSEFLVAKLIADR